MVPDAPTVRRIVLIAALLHPLAAISSHAAGTAPWRAGAPVEAEAAGSGELLWKSERGLIPLPVVDLDVELAVTGMLLRGTVHQTFTNPTAGVIEALYVFPLPERGAVDSMELRIGDRRLVAIVKEKVEAQAVYEAARQEGRKAALLQQARPNLFTTSVAGINPGESVVISLEYLEEVSFQDGSFGLAFPLTFTPRYAPGACVHPGTVVRRSVEDLPAAFTEGRDPLVPRATIDVRIEPGFPLESVVSPSHAIESRQESAGWRVALRDGPVVADRDFVLRWTVRQGDEPAGAVFVETRRDSRYGLIMLLPPAVRGPAAQGLPTRTLFLVDVSGSMGGASIAQARGALLVALDRLRPGDTFNMIKFNDRNEAFRESFLSPQDAALAAARGWIDSLEASGGTEILPALVRGLVMMAQGDTWPVQRVVLITDGAVGNEEEVLAEVARRLGSVRLYVIGIGAAPNRFFMAKLAQFGRGSYEFVDSVEEVGARLGAFLERIERPVMTDLALEWRGAAPLEVYPGRLPDLHAGEPLFLSLRLAPGPGPTEAVLKGRLAGGPLAARLSLPPGAPQGSGVAARWARAKVESLLDGLRQGADPEAVRREVIAVAKEFALVTSYTSLVAVEEYRTAEGAWTTHAIASALPHGSTFSGSTLPQGATLEPFMLLTGILLAALGGAVHLIWRRAR